MTEKERIKNAFIVAVILFLAVALWDSWANSEPYFICDTNDFLEVTGYQLEINGAIVDVEPAVINDNRQQLIYDLVEIPIGASAIRARMKTKLWPWTPWTEPFTVLRPGPLSNPQVVLTPPSP